MASHWLASRASVLTAAAAGLLLQACPQTLDDEFSPVDGLTAGSGGQVTVGAGGTELGLGGRTTGGSPGGGTGGISGGAPVGGTAGATGGIGGQAGAAGDPATGGSGNGSAIGGASGIGGAAGDAAASGSGATGGAGASGGLGGGDGGTGGGAGSSGTGADGGTGATGATGGTGARGGTGGTGGTSGMSGSGGTGGVLCTTSPADCAALRDALIHRYSFNGTGTDAVDSIGGADGTLATTNGTSTTNATLSNGAVELTSGYTSSGYVDLPNGLISCLDDATLEVWTIWNGGDAWQRIFDFGDALTNCNLPNQVAQEGRPGECSRTTLMLTPSTDGPPYSVSSSFVTVAGSHTSGDVDVSHSGRAPADTEQHYAVVVDDAAQTLALYINGALADSASLTDQHLSEINDINVWLGRSQYADDPGFDGAVLEFRIYNAALTERQLETSFTEGPDPEFLD